jgi:hypothetical protein
MRSLNAEGQRFLKEFSLIFLKKKTEFSLFAETLTSRHLVFGV